jgi:hypothetical protein
MSCDCIPNHDLVIGVLSRQIERISKMDDPGERLHTLGMIYGIMDSFQTQHGLPPTNQDMIVLSALTGNEDLAAISNLNFFKFILDNKCAPDTPQDAVARERVEEGAREFDRVVGQCRDTSADEYSTCINENLLDSGDPKEENF